MLIHVPLSQIDDNPFQARQEYGDIADLAGRIAAARANYPDSLGLMQIPRGRVTVTHSGEFVPGDDVALFHRVGTLEKDLVADLFRVQLAFGHRRLRAFRHLYESGAPGYEDGRFPVHVDALDDGQMLDAVWSENRERKDISAVEEAELLARKLSQSKSQREVAEAWGVDRSTVANRLRLLELPAEVQQANRDGRLSERSCLALAPVVEIQQAVNGQVKWGNKREHWGPPIAPADFIQQAINDPKITSDAIRDYTKQALAHVGRGLPKPIADMNAPQGGDIIRVSCSGCPKRINTTCLGASCLEAKKAAFQAATIAETEEVLGIPFSDRNEDFTFSSYDEKKLLKALWEAGQQRQGTSFVFGWRLGESAYRPFMDRRLEYVGGSSAWDGDGRSAIAIGHRGNLPLHLLPGDLAVALNPAADIPTWETRQAWRQAVKDYAKAAIGQVEAAVVDALYLKLDGTEDILQAFVRRPSLEWLDEYEKVLKEFVRFMWQYSPHMPKYDGLEDFDRANQFLRRAGLNAAAILSTGSCESDLHRQVIFALHGWYENRERDWNWPKDDTAAVLKQPLQAALAECQDESSRHELTRALRDVDTRLAEKVSCEEAAQASRKLPAANLAGDEDGDLYSDEDDYDYDAEICRELEEEARA